MHRPDVNVEVTLFQVGFWAMLALEASAVFVNTLHVPLEVRHAVEALPALGTQKLLDFQVNLGYVAPHVLFAECENLLAQVALVVRHSLTVFGIHHVLLIISEFWVTVGQPVPVALFYLLPFGRLGPWPRLLLFGPDVGPQQRVG